jgi:hypothetical protein
MIRIPVQPSIREQRYVVALGERRYVIRVEWMERLQTWYLHLATATDEPIVSGLRIHSQGYLLTGLVDDRKPGGQLLSVSLSDSERPPGFDELGVRTVILFQTWDELLTGLS